MKVGDLVKRAELFKEWMKHNSWMTLEEDLKDIGIIIGFSKNYLERVNVFWSRGELTWADLDDLEKISENR